MSQVRLYVDEDAAEHAVVRGLRARVAIHSAEEMTDRMEFL